MIERHVVRQLTAYCHHELTAAESSRVQQHLESCEPCRREYENIRLAVDLASRMTLQQAPDSLWGDVVRALDDSPNALRGTSVSPVRRVLPRWAFAVASLLLVSAARDELVLLAAEPTFLGSSPPRRQAQGGMERHW